MRLGVARGAAVAVLAGLLVLLLPGTGLAAGEAFLGRLTFEDEPVPGVEIVVSDDGTEIARAVSDADGSWRVDLPGPGTYTVELQTQTLPEGVALTDPDRERLDVQIFGGLQNRIVFNFDAAVTGAPLRDRLVQNTFSGFKTGLIIAITAVGLSLVFGTTGLINFAHGELVSLGAILAWFLNNRGPRLPLVAAALAAIVLGGAISGGLEAGFFAHLRRRRIAGFQFLVITIGLSLLFQSVLRLWYGNTFGQYRLAQQSALHLGPIVTNGRDLVIMGLCAVVLAGVGALLQLTRVGKAMRAVADNRDLAEASGIDVSRVILTVWVLGGSLATVGGIFQGATVNVHYLNGFKLLLLMFAAIILGGLGSAYGAMVGGIIVGLAMELSVLWASTELRQMWALLILVAVLLVRPQGILGRAERFG